VRRAKIKAKLKISLFLLFKMCSANEIALVYTFNGTYLTARTAINTLLVIYRCKIIFYNDSTRGAGFLTLSAGNTAVLAILSYLSTLVVIVTGNGNACCVTDKMDYAVRTFLNAQTASDTFSGVDGGKALIVYADCVTGAYLDAVAVAEAGKRAVIIARVIHIGGFTGFRTVVIVFLFFGKTKTVAGNVSNLLNYVLSLKA
jgi:hypothetical protein